jgi:hypothetical protein
MAEWTDEADMFRDQVNAAVAAVHNPQLTRLPDNHHVKSEIRKGIPFA